jgi:subtilisin family serine protease
VLAVTAVDAALKPWSKANRGPYISYAAPGVDVWSALPGKDGAYLSGTSYATPFAVAALAAARMSNPKRGWKMLLRDLQTQARDLGDKGKDPVFGWGLIQAKGCGTKTAQVR